jgi:GNAT superfamily N-acetyltransferase
VDLVIELIRNPWPPAGILRLELGRSCPEIIEAAVDNEQPVDEYFCGLAPAAGWSETMLRWYQSANLWIPRRIVDWWLPWFEREHYLEPMPLAWWRRRALAFAVAKDGDRLIAVCILTISYGGLGWQSNDSFEIRSAVVEPGYRRRGIFKRLVVELLKEAQRWSACRLPDLWIPTVVASRNPGLQGWFKRLEVELAGRFMGGHSEIKDILQLACWHPGRSPVCEICPRVSGNAWGWPTHRLLDPGVSWDQFV